MSAYTTLMRPALFSFADPETAHNLALRAMRCTPHAVLQKLSPGARACTRTAVELDALRTGAKRRYKHPVGLAAGMDKSAVAVGAWEALGFSHVEYGTVTPRAQTGRARPRMWRYDVAESLRNAMGFNNDGAEEVAQRLQEAARREAINSVSDDGFFPRIAPPMQAQRWRAKRGLSIGKQTATTQHEAFRDYEKCAAHLAGTDAVDYVVINVSSPNTAGLRTLQAIGALENILRVVRAQLEDNTDIFVKLSPDLSDKELCDLGAFLRECDYVDGVIAVNTSSDEATKRRLAASVGVGGVSGRALRTRALHVTRLLAVALDEKKPLIGVGGIMDARDAYQRICAGASLLQIYSTMIFNGPTVLREIVYGLADLYDQEDIACHADAVGKLL